MVCSRGETSQHTKTMAYSIASGRYFYEEGAFFSFDALIDKLDHSGAGTFKNGQRIKDELSPSLWLLRSNNVKNFHNDPWRTENSTTNTGMSSLL